MGKTKSKLPSLPPANQVIATLNQLGQLLVTAQNQLQQLDITMKMTAMNLMLQSTPEMIIAKQKKDFNEFLSLNIMPEFKKTFETLFNLIEKLSIPEKEKIKEQFFAVMDQRVIENLEKLHEIIKLYDAQAFHTQFLFATEKMLLEFKKNLGISQSLFYYQLQLIQGSLGAALLLTENFEECKRYAKKSKQNYELFLQKDLNTAYNHKISTPNFYLSYCRIMANAYYQEKNMKEAMRYVLLAHSHFDAVEFSNESLAKEFFGITLLSLFTRLADENFNAGHYREAVYYILIIKEILKLLSERLQALPNQVHPRLKKIVTDGLPRNLKLFQDMAPQFDALLMESKAYISKENAGELSQFFKENKVEVDQKNTVVNNNGRDEVFLQFANFKDQDVFFELFSKDNFIRKQAGYLAVNINEFAIHLYPKQRLNFLTIIQKRAASTEDAFIPEMKIEAISSDASIVLKQEKLDKLKRHEENQRQKELEKENKDEIKVEATLIPLPIVKTKKEFHWIQNKDVVPNKMFKLRTTNRNKNMYIYFDTEEVWPEQAFTAAAMGRVTPKKSKGIYNALKFFGKDDTDKFSKKYPDHCCKLKLFGGFYPIGKLVAVGTETKEVDGVKKTKNCQLIKMTRMVPAH